MKVTLPNGMVLEHDDPQELKKSCWKLGYVGSFPKMYFSKTHGWLEIKTMHTAHLRNALLSKYREWVVNLSSTNDRELINAIRNGCDDQTFIDLLTEFVSRVR